LKKNTCLIALSILTLNLLLKIFYIDITSIAWDEPFSIYHAQMELDKIVEHLYNGNNPPFFEILLHFWIKIFGVGPFSVRFLPLLFSCLTAVMLFILGNRFLSLKIGIITSLLFTFSNFHLFFAHSCRVYSLFGLLTVIAIYLFLCLIRDSKSKTFTFLLIFVNTLILYTHYFGFFVLAIQGISVIFIQDVRRKLFLKFVFIGLTIFFLFLPNLMILLERFKASASNGTWVEKPNGIKSLYNMLWNFSNQPINTVICLTILLAALIKLIIRKDFKQIQPEKKISAIWFLFPFFLMFLISFQIPMFLDRYLIFVSFGYYIVVAISLEYLIANKWLRTISSFILILLFAVTFKPNLDNKRHVKEAVAKTKELKDENTSVIICGRDFVLNFAYYYDLSLFTDIDQKNVYDQMISRFNKQDIFPVYSMPKEQQLKNKVLYFDAVADFSHPTNDILNTLNERYELVQVYHFETIFNLYEYQLKK